MKKLFFVVSMIGCSMTTYAAEPSNLQNSSYPSAQYYNQEQVVTAYYVSNDQLVRIKIKIRGSQVVAYSTGKDFIGNEQWSSITPASITRTNSTFDGNLAREFSQKATLNITNGYQRMSLTVYF